MALEVIDWFVEDDVEVLDCFFETAPESCRPGSGRHVGWSDLLEGELHEQLPQLKPVPEFPLLGEDSAGVDDGGFEVFWQDILDSCGTQSGTDAVMLSPSPHGEDEPFFAEFELDLNALTVVVLVSRVLAPVSLPGS